MKKTRSANVELYRILLMFGIFLLHVVYHGGNRLPWVSNGLRWCVDGFVFISGWYGIDFRPSKVMRLVAVAVFASGIAIAVGICTGGDGIFLPPGSRSRRTR